jgi:hypothetical protein
MGHHYVPQRYLRNFEVKERPGFVWQYPKRGGEPRCVSIKKAAQSPGFYEPEMESFLDWGVERKGGDAIDKLLVGKPLDEQARQELAFHLAVMMKRTPAYRRWAREQFAELLPARMAEYRELLKAGHLAFSGDVEKDLAEFDRLERLYELEPPSTVMDQVKDPTPTATIFGAILSMHWRLFVTSGPQLFITSDNPFFFTKSCGLGNPDSEMFLPLSPTHMLHGARKDPVIGIPRFKMPQSIVRASNSRTAFFAEYFAYTHAPAPWLPSALARMEVNSFLPEWKPKRL